MNQRKKFYEGGAHFKYVHLYTILTHLANEQANHINHNKKQLTASHLKPSIKCHNNNISHKKIVMIKLKKDREHLNTSLPNY